MIGQRRKSLVVTLKGKIMFNSREEVLDYLNADKIECLECGNLFKGLAPHLVAAHSLTVQDYKTKYGIPQYIGLSGTATKDNRSAAILKRHEEGLVDKTSMYKVKPDVSKSRAKPEWHQRKFYSAGKKANKSKRISKKTYDEYLHRLTTGRTLNDVSTDSDMPSFASVYSYAKKNPSFNVRLRAVTRKYDCNLTGI